MRIRTDVCVCAWWLLVEEGSGIHTRPSIIMTGSRKYNPFTVTWLPAVLATKRGKREKMIGSACVCVRMCVFIHLHVGHSVWMESV